MSERPPVGWDSQTTRPPSVEVGDDILAGHLRRRGAQTAPRTLTTAILARVDGTARERRWRLTLVAWRPRMAVAVSGLTLALVAGLLYVNATPRIGTDRASTSPSAPPSPVASGPVWDPTQRALTPPELLRILATPPAPGTVLIVDDQIAKLNLRCPFVGPCPNARLVNAGVGVEPPRGGHLPFDGDSEIPGPLALQVASGPNLVFLGAVLSNGLRMEFRALDLLRRSAMGGLFVVPGWLWAAAAVPCASGPTSPMPMPTSELGLTAPRLECAPSYWLTDTESADPAHPSGVEFPVQAGTYGAFTIPASGTTGARKGIYLVRDWAGYGEILARLEPLPIPSDEANGPTASPTESPTSPSESGSVMSVDELVGGVLGGTLADGAIVVASIPAAAVTTLSPSAAGAPDGTGPSRWIIVGGAGFVRVDDVPTAGIAGLQAFLVEPAHAVRALGPASLAAPGLTPTGLFVVHGWLRIGPPLPCPAPLSATDKGILGEPLYWSQCPGTWILPSALDPWAGPPNVVRASDGSGSGRFGDISVPAGTFHVQDGAPGLDLQPQPHEGTWLVRAAKASECPPWQFCRLHLDPQPSWGVTWYELVGPIVAPNAAVVAPSPPSAPLPSGIVLTQDQLVSAIGSGAVPIGSIVIATATIAPVILPSFPPDAGAVAGKIGPIRVHWASDPSLSAADLHQIALRVRPDGDLDYLGPVAIGQANAGSTNALFLVQTLQGPVLIRRIDCDSPQSPAVCPLAEGDAKTLILGPVYVPASAR